LGILFGTVNGEEEHDYSVPKEKHNWYSRLCTRK